MTGEQPTVLFLCADNSTRSQLGEALLRHRAGSRFDACSAGLAPKPVHPLVKEVLREIGLDPAPLEAKQVRPFLGNRSVRYAVILRSPEETDAPRIFPFAARTIRWEVADPASSSEASDAERVGRFRQIRDEIDAHVREWLVEIDAEHRSSAA